MGCESLCLEAGMPDGVVVGPSRTDKVEDVVVEALLV